jgi:hypothetical protein
MYLLDTDTIIYNLKGNEQVLSSVGVPPAL